MCWPGMKRSPEKIPWHEVNTIGTATLRICRRKMRDHLVLLFRDMSRRNSRLALVCDECMYRSRSARKTRNVACMKVIWQVRYTMSLFYFILVCNLFSLYPIRLFCYLP